MHSEFHRLNNSGELTPGIADHLAASAAAAFMAEVRATGQYRREAVDLLCQMATLPDENLAKAGLKGLFPLIVERLADSFEPTDCSLYYRVFAQVVQLCRSVPAGLALDAQLNRFCLRTEEELLERVDRTRRAKPFDLSQAGRVRKVLVLSRITLGADVEITSIILQEASRLFPGADIVLVGEDKARELFGGDHRIRLRSLRYHRSGGLIERLASWLSVVEAIQDETQLLNEREYLVIDPDSRLTQLGLLPVTPDDAGYYFFESRGYRRADAPTLAQLTVCWLNEVFDLPTEHTKKHEKIYPSVSLRENDLRSAGALVQKLRGVGATFVVSLSFGIGGNPAKRIPDPFEEKLVLCLMENGATIILDKGSGEDELWRVDRLIARLRERGKTVVEIDEQDLPEALTSSDLRAQVMTWQGGIGVFSALISQSDQYIGYDSAGQHIAAALGVPTIVVFAGFTSPLVPERWRPQSRAAVRTIVVDTLNDRIDPEAVLSDVMEHHHRDRGYNGPGESDSGISRLQ